MPASRPRPRAPLSIIDAWCVPLCWIYWFAESVGQIARALWRGRHTVSAPHDISLNHGDRPGRPRHGAGCRAVIQACNQQLRTVRYHADLAADERVAHHYDFTDEVRQACRREARWRADAARAERPLRTGCPWA